MDAVKVSGTVSYLHFSRGREEDVVVPGTVERDVVCSSGMGKG